jgi:hypothetical protein
MRIGTRGMIFTMSLLWDPKNRAEGIKVRDAFRDLDTIAKGGYFAAAAVFVDLLRERISPELADVLYKGGTVQEYREARKKAAKTLALAPRPLGTPNDAVNYLPLLIADDLLESAIAIDSGQSKTGESLMAADAMANLVYYFAMKRTLETGSSPRFVAMPTLRQDVVGQAFDMVFRAIQSRSLKQSRSQQRQQAMVNGNGKPRVDVPSAIGGAIVGGLGIWLLTSSRGGRA